MAELASVMEPWQRYFIVDTSVKTPRLAFGRGFSGFQENGDPDFTYRPEKVKLYEKQEQAIEDFNKIIDKVEIIHIIIQTNPNRQTTVAHARVASK